MIPWHCLVCPCCWDDGPRETSLPSLIGYGLKQLYSYGIGEDIETPGAFADLGLSFEPRESAPTWVGLLREGRGSEGTLVEVMGRLNLKGVAIIEETEVPDE